MVTRANSALEEREGYTSVMLPGRGWPTAELAREKLRASLEKYGIEIRDEDLVARRWADGGFCPWEAIAYIPTSELRKLELDTRKVTDDEATPDLPH